MSATFRDEARLSEITGELRSLHAAAGDAELSGEARARWDALEREQRTIADRVARQRAIDAADRAAPGTPLDGGDRHYNEFRDRVGVLDAIRASAGATDARAGRARELSAEMERRSGRKARQGGILWDMGSSREHRALTSGQQGTSGNGGPLVPNILRGDAFIDILRARPVVRALGATVLSGLDGLVSLPKRLTSFNAAWFQEGASIPASDSTYGGVTLTPKHCGAIGELSVTMANQTSPDVEALAQADIAAVLGEALDRAAIAGDGTGYSPVGVLHLAARAATYSGTAPAWADIAGALASLESANATPTAWAIAPGVGPALMQVPKSATSPQGFVFDAPGGQLAGLPAAVGGNLPPGTLIAGNWSDVIIGLWNGVEILSNPYGDAYSRGGIQVRGILTADVAVRHPESFVTLSKASS